MSIEIDKTDYDHKGHTITVRWFHDEDCDAPWENDDGHGPVSDWRRGCEKRPGERELCSDRNSIRFYDYAEAIKIARRDGWDAPPYKTGTKGEQAVRAVEADFELLRAWCNNEWHWAGYVVEIEGMNYDEALWGIDSPSIKEYEAEAVKSAREWLDNELAESERAACGDVLTV